MRLVRAAIVVVAVLGCLPGCSPARNRTRASPAQFGTIQIPSSTQRWTTVGQSAGGVYDVLPVQGRGVRLVFYAPQDSAFGVSLVDPTGARTTLTQNTGTPAPPDSGLFSIVDQNRNNTPAIWTMFVRPAADFMSPLNYSINVIVLGTGTSLGSAPMIVPLVSRPVYAAHIAVVGDGHVTSNPPGIQCGRSSLSPLTDCDFDFGQSVTLSLNPGSNQGARFIGWTGNCQGRQSCVLALGGNPVSVTAAFEADTGTTTLPSTCVAPPTLPGLRWIGEPACSGIADHPGITLQCDGQGFFCCSPQNGATGPRCGGGTPGGGQNTLQSNADCHSFAPRGLLVQPGGCYESAAPPH